MLTNGFYPELHIGDDIMWGTAPETPASQWRLGRVAVTKNFSCDIVVYMPDGSEYRHDCLHKDDPRCLKGREHLETGRGVFQLANCEIEKRDMIANLRLIDQLPRFEARLRLMERAYERLPPREEQVAKPVARKQ